MARWPTPPVRQHRVVNLSANPLVYLPPTQPDEIRTPSAGQISALRAADVLGLAA
jgi:hypothetical protein